MLDIGIGEIIVILVLGLIILGPEKLPTAIRTILVWWKRMKTTIDEAKHQVEQEVNYTEMTQNIENYKQSIQQVGDDLQSTIDVDTINKDTGKSYASEVTQSAISSKNTTDSSAHSQ